MRVALSISDSNQADAILDDLVNIDTSYFQKKVSQIHHTKLQFNKADPYLDLSVAIRST